MVPGDSDPALWAEHVSRYAMAAQFANGRRVLDYACGTGYGTAMLKKAGAAMAIGVDRDAATIAFARARFAAHRLRFFATDCLGAGLRENTFDLIVSFETIEHVAPHESFLDEVTRLLIPGGRLILSTPNKATYSDERPDAPNPFHTHEFYLPELRHALGQRFASVLWYGQSTAESVVFTNVAAPDDNSAGVEQRSVVSLGTGETGGAASLEHCDYFVVICSEAFATERPSHDLPSYFFVSGTNEIRDKRNRILRLQEEVLEKNDWAMQLDRTISDHRFRIEALTETVALQDETIRDGSARVAGLTAAIAEHDALLAAERDQVAHLKRRQRSLANRLTRLHGRLATIRAARPERPPAGPIRDIAGVAAATSSESCRRILFIQSGSAERALRSIRIMQGVVAPGARLLYVTHSLRACPAKSELPPDTEILETSTSFRDLLALRALVRVARCDTRVLMLTGERGFRRLKLFGLLLVRRDLLVFNENGDCFYYSFRAMTRHFLWRLREALALERAPALFAAAWRVLREDGLREVVKRVGERLAAIRNRRHPVPLMRGSCDRIESQTFPFHERPDISVVVPVHDQHLLTFRCLRSILENAGDLHYEIIVVDDASGPDTRSMLDMQTNVQIVRLETNQGFVAACNSGAKLARGEVILFLNNDTEIAPETLRAFLDTFERNPRCGVVGGKLLYPDGSLQEAGGLVWRDGTAWNCGRSGDPSAPQFNYVREVDYCSGAALAVKRSLFERLGGFDDHFAPGYWEDTDLCFRARREGFAVLYQPDATVIHLEGMTAGRNTDQGMKAFQSVNGEKFYARWKSELEQTHLVHAPERFFQARDRNRAPVILVIDHYVPTPDRDAGSLVMYKFLLALRELGYRTIFWPDNLFRTQGYAEDLQQSGIEVIYGTLDFSSWFGQAGRFIDVVVAHRAKIAEKYFALLGPPTQRRIYICADLEHLRESRRVAATGESSANVESLWKRETAIAERVHQIAVHSPVERAILEEALQQSTTRVSILPLPVRPAIGGDPPFARREHLLFVGSTHPPNVDAISFFDDTLCELLKRRLPGVRLTVAGEASRKVKPKNSRELELVGFVPDLSSLYASRRVFVAPLRYGAGIKGKVLEAMSFGLPVVTTTIGAEGIAISNGVSGFIADTPEEFADAVQRIYTDEALWASVREEARRIIARDYSEQAFIGHVRELVWPDLPADRVVRSASVSKDFLRRIYLRRHLLSRARA